MFKIELRNVDGLLAKPFESLVTICSADHLEASFDHGAWLSASNVRRGVRTLFSWY
jgi:hypothetical protein